MKEASIPFLIAINGVGWFIWLCLEMAKWQLKEKEVVWIPAILPIIALIIVLLK